MFRQILRSTSTLCSAVVAPKAIVGAEVNEGWERVKRIFKSDNDTGTISPELNTICHTTLITGLAGACYGGFIQSREAYLRFFERNQATQFTDHFEAKKKLQDFVTVNFAKGAMKWSWRIALFGGCYITVVTLMSAYRGDTSIFDFIVGGMVSGGLNRINYGTRGVIVGSTLGFMIGMLAGAMTMTLFRLTDTKLDDVRQYQMEYAAFRDRNFAEATKKSYKESELHGEYQLAKAHDVRVSDDKVASEKS